MGSIQLNRHVNQVFEHTTNVLEYLNAASRRLAAHFRIALMFDEDRKRSELGNWYLTGRRWNEISNGQFPANSMGDLRYRKLTCTAFATPKKARTRAGLVRQTSQCGRNAQLVCRPTGTVQDRLDVIESRTHRRLLIVWTGGACLCWTVGQLRTRRRCEQVHRTDRNVIQAQPSAP